MGLFLDSFNEYAHFYPFLPFLATSVYMYTIHCWRGSYKVDLNMPTAFDILITTLKAGHKDGVDLSLKYYGLF